VRSRAFLASLICLALAVGWLVATLNETTTDRRAAVRRVPVSRALADTFMDVLCRPPSDGDAVYWQSRPFDRSAVEQAFASTVEGQRVGAFQSVFLELLRRDATVADCPTIRRWMDAHTTIDEARHVLAEQPEARRVARVRQAFVDALGRDPRAWDDLSLRRWVDSPYTVPEIRTRLAQQRPLVGVHYFMWYRPIDGWGNGFTSVAADAPRPVIGPYDSSDTDVITTQITQMEEAGFDFVLVHIVFNQERAWTNAHIFMDRLSGHRLKAAIVLDGLYKESPDLKARWVRKVRDEYAANSHYLRLYGQPLVALFSSRLNFAVPGVILRNVYWTPTYDPGSNTFNPKRLEPRDWAFWAPVPQPLVNGMVPVVPGYNDAALKRDLTMVYARDNGRYYEQQWQRALMLRPEFIIVYGWNEYFEQTAIEPATPWGDQYLQLSTCYIAKAHGKQRTGC